MVQSVYSITAYSAKLDMVQGFVITSSPFM